MAKKKSKGASQGDKNDDASSIATTDNIPASGLSSAATSVAHDVPVASISVQSNEEVNELKRQLETALKTIEVLKEQLAEKDKTIEGLKSSASSSTVPASMDYKSLQHKLMEIKKDQQEAQAAREAAWKNLRSVVGEITKLTSDEKFVKTPTAALTASITAPPAAPVSAN